MLQMELLYRKRNGTISAGREAPAYTCKEHLTGLPGEKENAVYSEAAEISG